MPKSVLLGIFDQVEYNIVRGDRPQGSAERQYFPVYRELGWVISLK